MWNRRRSRLRGPRPRRFQALPLALLLGVGLGTALAQTPERPGAPVPPSFTLPDSAAGATPVTPTVGTVSVRGNQATDSLRILRSFEIAPGSEYSDEGVRRGLRKLFALGLFEDAWIETLPRGNTVDLVIHVAERRRIARIDYTGNEKRKSDELEKKTFLKVGEPYSPVQVRGQVDTLLRYYRDEGFPQASIEAQTDTTPGAGQVVLRFVIREGERVRIREIEFVGVRAFPAKKLRKQLTTKTKGFFGGGDVKEEHFQEDVEKLVAYYRNHGHRDAQVLGHELVPGKVRRSLILRFTIQEGPRYEFGTVGWSGNTVVSTEMLEKLWHTKKRTRLYDASRIQRAQGLAYGEYAEHGYLYLNIEPVEAVRDSLVDVNFVVTEGKPSQIRLVKIGGNRGTREKVIRREIDIHEGDRFNRSALVRTQGDIMRLGFFENVEIDFSPAESTDVDINLKVKEKNVGTASAGAGYTGESGLTGFLELGHNNVLGNGQSVTLHLERGPNRSDYYLSFAEPWFRDTPTLLGFSVFSTDRERDVYNESRRGGSIRTGRPLPWPDYSRGSISFRLEDVTIERTSDVLSPQDSIALLGIDEGDAVRTNTLGLGFVRNSTDNPFYPSKGSRFTLDDEVVGGPFGGSINFHKHRVEGRVYLPSIRKGITTMLRARLGLVGKYADQNHAVPTYERFRLGGGTTVDPLRGYDDYQIVPDKFITEVPVAYDTVVTGPDTTITPITAKVRYPGGQYMMLYSLEQQFPIVPPLRGVLFLDLGNTWDLAKEIKPFRLKKGLGFGIRIEVPLLGNLGFDYAYGFDRDDGARFAGHFLIGQPIY